MRATPETSSAAPPNPAAAPRASRTGAVRALWRMGPGAWIRTPGAALALARKHGGDPRDPDLVPLLDRVLARTRPEPVVRQRAQLAVYLGDLSLGRDLWAELAARGSKSAARHARAADGRLVETDPAWLPRAEGPVEPIVPVSRRRILHLVKNAVPDRWSGYTIRTHNNLLAQRDAGLDPIAVTGLGWPWTAGVLDAEPVVQIDGLSHYRIRGGPVREIEAMPSDERLVRLTEALVPLVRELRPAVLHAHSGHRGGELALVALALRERFGIPVVYEVRGLFESVWSDDEEIARRSELYARRLALETRVLGEVDHVLVISEALIEELASRGIARSRMTLLPNGIDPASFTMPERDAALRGRLGMDGRFVVGYVGNLDHPREGMEVLMAAVAELRSRGRDDVGILIVGDGSRRQALETAAVRLGVADRCRFTGRVPHDEVTQYYAQIDLFTCPRIEERAARFITPLKPFEAMALGIPVLVSDLPALEEIVDPPNRGMSAPVGDPVGLADQIERLRDDPALRQRIADEGRRWVRTERTWASNGPRYMAAYESLLGPLVDA